MADARRSRERAGGGIATSASEGDAGTTASYRGRGKESEKENLPLALFVHERVGDDEEGLPSGLPFGENLPVYVVSGNPNDKYNPADSAREAFVRELLNAPVVFDRSVFTSEAAQRHVLSVIDQLQLTARLYESAAREAEATHAVTKRAWEEERNRADLANVELRALRNELMELKQLHVERCLSRVAPSSDRRAPEMLMTMGTPLADVRRIGTPLTPASKGKVGIRIDPPKQNRSQKSPPLFETEADFSKERNLNMNTGSSSADEGDEREKPCSCCRRHCENRARARSNERAESFSKSPQQCVAAGTTNVPLAPTPAIMFQYSDRLVLPACTFCNKRQTPKESQQRFYRQSPIHSFPIHSFSTVAQSFSCPLCAKVYPQMKALESHMRKRHGVNTDVGGNKTAMGGKQEEVIEWLGGRLPPNTHDGADGHLKYTHSHSPYFVSSEAMESFAEEVRAMRTTVGRLFEGGIASRTNANEGHSASRDRGHEVEAGVVGATTTATVDLLQQAMAMLRAQQVQLDTLVAERSDQSQKREKMGNKVKGKTASRSGTPPMGDAAVPNTTFTKVARGMNNERGSRGLSVSAHNKLFPPVVASPANENTRERSAAVEKTISKSTRISESPAPIVVKEVSKVARKQPEREMHANEKRKGKKEQPGATERTAQSPSLSSPSTGKDRVMLAKSLSPDEPAQQEQTAKRNEDNNYNTNTKESAVGNFLSKHSAFSAGVKEEDTVPPPPLHETTAHPLPPAPSASLNMWEGRPVTIQPSREEDTEGIGLVYSPFDHKYNDRRQERRSRMVSMYKEGEESGSRTPLTAHHSRGGSYRIDEVHRPLFSSASHVHGEESVLAQQRLESARGIVDKVATLADLVPTMNNNDSDGVETWSV